LLKGFGHHKGHCLPVVLNAIAVQLRRGARIPVFGLKWPPSSLRGSVLVCQHQQHTRRAFSGAGVDFSDLSFGHGGLNDVAIGRHTAFFHFMGIGCLAHDFESAFDTVDGLADQSIAVLVNRVARCGLVHVHDELPVWVAIKLRSSGSENRMQRATQQGQFEIVVAATLRTFQHRVGCGVYGGRP
jgi:hypothetical protein